MKRDDLILPGLVLVIILWALFLETTIGLETLRTLLGWNL